MALTAVRKPKPPRLLLPSSAPAPSGPSAFEVPDTIIEDLRAHLHDGLAERTADKVEERQKAKAEIPPAPPASEASRATFDETFASGAWTRPAARPTRARKPAMKKTNGNASLRQGSGEQARKAPPSAPPPA